VARASHGFTAIELMVVVAIIAILAALAGPSFTPLIERWRVRDAAETLTSSLYYARSEAIKRGGNVIIIKNPNSGECTTATNATEWGCGWRIFFDVNGNRIQDACVPANTPNECDLQVIAAPKRLALNLTDSTGSISIDRWGMHSHTDAADSTPDELAFKLMPQGKDKTDASAATLCAGRGGRIVRKKGSEDC
jgi:type IV fimbrial biogenesis protein FimT